MFINKSKEDRARRVVKNPNEFKDVDCVERKALAMGLAENLSGEDLVTFVYEKIGGALPDQPVKRDIREGIIDEVVEGSEVEVVGEKPKRAKKSA